MKRQSHEDLKTLRRAFECNLKDSDQIYDSLRPLYNILIADQGRHSQNRKRIA
jgi:hypothetical protein